MMVDTIARHEAGHAVMRWVLGWPATRLEADETGGFCAGTGRKVLRPHDVIAVKLAGFAAEAGMFAACVDLAHSDGHDFAEARRVIAANPAWFEGTAAHALQQWFERTCETLALHQELIDDLALRLAAEGALSARTVAAICREYAKRQTMETAR